MSDPRAEATSPVRRLIVPAAAALSVATIVLILYSLVVPDRALLALRWYLLVAGVLAIVAASRVIVARYPVLWRATDPLDRDAAASDEVPARLRAIDRLVTRAEWDAAGFELELRPILRAIAAQRLATYRTIDIDTEPAAAREVLGETVWELLTPVDIETARRSKGIDPRMLRLTVEKLEELGGDPHP